MESSPTIHSFSPHAPFKYTITIIHFIAMSVAFIGCYPCALTQHTSRHSQKRRLIFLVIGVVFVLVGFVTSVFIPYSSTTSSSISVFYFCLTFGLLCLVSLELAFEYINTLFSHQHQQENDWSHQHHHEQQTKNTSGRLYLWAYGFSNSFRLILTWVTVCLGYFYFILGVLVFTSTCESFGQSWVSLATGSGFILSGSLTLLYFIGILVLPNHSNQEYYETIWILLWGCLSFFWWDTPVVGSSWKGINFSLLWTTGGLLSLVMHFQTWLPLLRKRNIVNSIIICLTGKGVLSGHSEDDFYAMDLQTTLGTLLIIGSVAKFTQIMLRKSGTDSLPRLYSRIFSTNDENCDDDRTCVNDLGIGQQQERSTEYESTYRQLTGMNSSPSSSCKHQSVYASISMVCGLLSCFTTISGGLFFIGTNLKWVEIMQYYISDSTTYVNVILAMAFLWISYLMILCWIYKCNIEPTDRYDYLGVATGNYCELPVSTQLSSSPTTSNFDTHSTIAMMNTPTSPTSTTYDPTSHQPIFTSIPLGTLRSASTKHHSSASATTLPSHGTAVSPPPIRPSQYRAKRRSLLISTGKQHHDNGGSKRGSRTLSSSSYTGVGGVLPDDFCIYDEHYISSPIHSTSPEQPMSPPPDHYSSNQHYQQQQQQRQEWHSPTFEQQSWQSVTSSSPPHVTSTSSTMINNDKMEQSENDGSAEQQFWSVQKNECGTVMEEIKTATNDSYRNDHHHSIYPKSR